jgi:hypothetical protein
MKRLWKYAVILVVILIPLCLLVWIVLGMMDAEAELADWVEEALGAPADRLPDGWDMPAITAAATRAAGVTGGTDECHVIAWKTETDATFGEIGQCIAWIHHQDLPNESWALVQLRHELGKWRPLPDTRRTGGAGTLASDVYGHPLQVKELKDFMDRVQWSFAPSEGKTRKDADIARHAGQRIFGLHMNFLQRRYAAEPPPPPPPPPEKRAPVRPRG